MSNYIKVDTDILSGDIDNIKQSINVASSQINSVYTEVTALNAMWKGKANEAFCARFSSDYKTIKKYVKEIDKLTSLISDDRAAYEQCEQNATNMVQNINV